jgi:hypothetical protein
VPEHLQEVIIVSLRDNLTTIEHNSQTNEIKVIKTTEAELKVDISLEIIAMREANLIKEASRKAVYERLGLTPEEIKLLS